MPVNTKTSKHWLTNCFWFTLKLEVHIHVSKKQAAKKAVNLINKLQYNAKTW